MCDDARVEQGGSFEGILLTKISANEMRLFATDRARGNHQAIHIMETAKQHLFDAAMSIRQAGDNPRQLVGQFSLGQIENAVGQALRPRQIGAARGQRFIGRYKWPDDHSRGVGAQLDRQGIYGDVRSHSYLEETREGAPLIPARQAVGLIGIILAIAGREEPR